MSSANQLPVYLRNIRAKLRPLRQPILWGTIGFLGLFTMFSWELWFRSTEFFLSEELNPEATEDSRELPSESQSPEAIAADIDSSPVLKEDMKGYETPAPIIPPNPPLPPEKSKKTDNRQQSRSTPSPPPETSANPPRNQNAQGLSNVFLSGNVNTLPVNNFFPESNSVNEINGINPYGMNSWSGNSNQNGNTINSYPTAMGTQNLGMTMSPLQAAIIRRSTSNIRSSPSANETSSTPTQTQGNHNQPPESAFGSLVAPVLDPNQNTYASISNSSISNSSISNSSLPNANISNASISNLTNQLPPEAQLNLINLSGVANTNPASEQNSGQFGLREPVNPQAELFIPLSPASSRGVNNSQRGYNSNINSTDAYNSYQYLLESSQSNPTTSGMNSGVIINPRSVSSSSTPLAPSTYPQNYNQPNLPGNQFSPNPVSESNLGTMTQPPLSTTTQPSAQPNPILRSVPIPQGLPNTTPNANGPIQSASPGQPLQPTYPFSVPRPIPGRYIGGGQINTFSNP